MKLSEILKQDARGMYRATEGLFRKVDDLAWKPATGSNWMTTAQLLRHCTDACGKTIHGFVVEGWGIPPGTEPSQIPAEEMLPKAEDLPAVESIDEALRLLTEDRGLCLQVLEEVDEDRLLSERSSAPWGGPEVTLFQHCSGMIWHLGQHKGQLFYYLKLQGKDVDTMDLWSGGS
jgi:hypothetical protein